MKKLLLVVYLISTALTAQTGGIRGQIFNNGAPVPGINILLLGTFIGDETDINGYYEIENIPAGAYTIQFSAIGYKSKKVDIDISENRVLELNIELEHQAIEIGEVEVTDNKMQTQSDTRTSLINLNPKSARVMPGAVTDVFRTLQSLPGVLAPNDFSSQLIIRGSGPDQNLIVMDDVEVFNPYRLYGVISMFNPEAVSDINLITGGFPARYGDRLSAVLDVTNRQGSLNSGFTGNLNVSIVSANLVLEGKNPFNLPGSWLVNSRRTYYDLIIEPFVKNTGLVEENVSFPNFYDVQTKLTFGPFNNHKFFINGVYSRDGVQLISGSKRETADSIGIVDVSKNDLFSAAWHYTPSDKLLNKVIVSWYRNGGDSNFDSELLDPSLDRTEFEDIAPDTVKPYLLGFGFDTKFIFSKYSFENRLNYIWSEGNELELGLGYDIMQTLINFEFDLDPQLKSFLNFNPNIRASFEDLNDEINYNRVRSYIHNKFSIGKFFLQPGLRFDYYDIMNKYYLAPRFSLSYAVDKVNTIRGVWGVFYQSIGYEKLRDRNRLYNFDRSITTRLEAEKSTHYILSFERWLSEQWSIKLETYIKDFQNLIEPVVLNGTGYIVSPVPGTDPNYISGWSNPVPVTIDSITTVPANNSYGKAYGFEMLFEKKNLYDDDKLNGWLSYSLSYADRFIDGRKIPFRFDQRHTVNVVANYKINEWLDVGVRFQYGSGFPLTKATGIKPRIILKDTNNDLIPETPVIATRGQNDQVVFDVDYGDKANRFTSRKPDYHRLDVRLNAKAGYWDLDWIFYLDIINIYNHDNIVNYDYYISQGELKREATTMFPILPTLGFNVRF